MIGKQAAGALAEAFKQIPPPTVENVNNVESESVDSEVSFKRDKDGRIQSAKITEASGD